MADDDFDYWKVAMLVNGLHAEFDIKSADGDHVTRDPDEEPAWIEQLPEAPPEDASTPPPPV